VNFSIVVTVRPTLTASLANPATICSGAAVAAVSPTSNITGTTYTWTLGAITGGVTGAAAQATAQAQFSTGNLSNAGAVNGTVTYNITATNAATCNTVNFSIVVTVRPTLTARLANPATICSGAAVAAVSPTRNIAGTTYTWTLGAITGGVTGAAAQATAQAQFSTGNLSNAGAVYGTVTYKITATNAATCNTVNFSIVVTVRPTLTASLANPATICSGAAVAAVSPTSNIAGTTYTWTLGAITGGVTGAAAQATAQAQFSTGNLSNAGAVDGTVTYNITATNAATCNTVNFSIVVTVRPTLTASLANPATICSGAAVAAVSPTSNIAGTTYTWTLGAITGGVTGAAAQATAQAQFSTGNLSNAGAVDGTVTYNITATNAATCNTVNFSIVVTVR
ncbi:MAG: hypothetical protein CFE21_23430, partial [Bacteroidetes bacterium B1(2017)]